MRGGSSAGLSSGSHTGNAVGTLAYMAPELLDPDAPTADEAADCYAMGVVLWELFTGQIPWDGKTVHQIISTVGVYGRFLQIPSELDPAIKTLLEQFFQQRDKRITAAGALETLRNIQSTIEEKEEQDEGNNINGNAQGSGMNSIGSTGSTTGTTTTTQLEGITIHMQQ